MDSSLDNDSSNDVEIFKYFSDLLILNTVGSTAMTDQGTIVLFGA